MAMNIEHRVQFSEPESAELVAQLQQCGEDLGPDDRHIWFYVMPDKAIEVVHSVSRDTAMIVVKTSHIGSGTPDIELSIATDEVSIAVQIFDSLGFAEYVHRTQNTRHNWRYRGVQIAVMWSQAWAHHAELRVTLPDTAGADEVRAAKALVQSVADELGVRLASEDELVDFIQSFEVKEPETAGN
ncbi:adenylate cyclase class IV [Allocatelliglobosispora scoriae]|uniref:Adenylate cyclase class IV n=1 Tax=Allocatelliglobosispora scoriae TaxID=643052 RepID=A0A841BLY8_9ACTN|nr:hypothetical protein [Allocatelliglobosispora scoriae]MBB5868209.1 adenylate cyclase class IV [Allocatelliglobosispora scoriae]